MYQIDSNFLAVLLAYTLKFNFMAQGIGKHFVKDLLQIVF